MFKLPTEFKEIMSVFSKKFSTSVFNRARLLVLGTLLTHGGRTVCSVLRTLGLQQIKNWDLYHRVLSRAKWDVLGCGKALLELLLKRFVKGATVVLGIDETVERRWGKQIKARGIYRDSVRSSKSHFVKCSGLRWISVMLLVPVSWANRVWALPFLSVLSPSSRYREEQGKQHKTISDWARQLSCLLSRWLKHFQVILVGDGTYAVLELLAATPGNVTWITRLRMDAALYDFPPVYEEGEKRPMGRPAIKGQRQASLQERANDPATKWQTVCFSQWYGQQNKRMEITSGTAIWYRAGKPAVPIRWVLVRDPQGKLETAAIQSTNLELTPIEIVRHYVKRWSVEVTFEEVRAHLGVETQRQWSDLSIARTTPVLLALFSVVTLWADYLQNIGQLTTFSTAWYQKRQITFSDALACVRYRIWNYQFSLHSVEKTDRNKNRRHIIRHLAYMAARAA